VQIQQGVFDFYDKIRHNERIARCDRRM